MSFKEFLTPKITAQAPPNRLVPIEHRGRVLDIVLHEYDAIRSEIVTSLSSQVSILSFGVAALGLIGAAAASLWGSSPEASGCLFLFATPIVCFITVIVYIVEQVRLMRAGLFLNHLENWVNESLEFDLGASPAGAPLPRVLTWEQWVGIRTGTGDIDAWNRRLIISMFVTMSLGFSVIGFAHVVATGPGVWPYLGLAFNFDVTLVGLGWVRLLGSYALAFRERYVYHDRP